MLENITCLTWQWGVFLQQLNAAPLSSSGLCAQFDGAARGNPQGPASWGCALWWGYWRFTDFEPVGLLEEHGCPIGVASNNLAEYLGCAFSLELIISRLT